MATYNKFNQFIEDVMKKVHNVSTDTLKLLLTNTAPVAGDIKVNDNVTPDQVQATSNAVELAAGNGYTQHGAAVTITTSSQSAGTFTLAGNQVVWTCVTAAMGPFRYVVLYNSSGGSLGARPVIAWWDYGSSVTLNVGETFTVKFNNANPGNIFTAS